MLNNRASAYAMPCEYGCQFEYEVINLNIIHDYTVHLAVGAYIP